MNALAIDMIREQDRQISDVVERQRPRLRNFIRQRVADPNDVEDILQDVFFELVDAYRLMKPIEQAGGWLFRVARNRIIDRFRKKRPESFSDLEVFKGEEPFSVDDLLPSPDAGPEATYARSVLLEELEAALDELPLEHAKFLSRTKSKEGALSNSQTKPGAVLTLCFRASAMRYCICGVVCELRTKNS
jgi:RNA polymerase sigma factor (sigma-70 family)